MNNAISNNSVPLGLTSEQWQHITTGHPEIAGYYYEIPETIEMPDTIYEGNNDAKIAIKEIRENIRMFVVVVYKETNSNDGFIITAHLTTDEQKLKKKKILWKRQI